MEFDYDLVVIGGGPGGYEAALEAAGTYGMRTALVEKEALGGTCLNRGCIPTKSLLHSAELLRRMQDAERFGLHAADIGFDWEAVRRRKDEVIDEIRSGLAMRMKQSGIEVQSGVGKILDSHHVEVSFPNGNGVLTTRFILISSGSAPAIPPIKGADLPNVVTSDGLLARRDAPYERLLIIGGGVIGVEFASVFSAFGSKVTILEALPRIISNMDKELSQSLKMLLKKRGVDVHTGALVREIREAEDGSGQLTCLYTEKDKEYALPADGILICTGRRPCVEDLFAEGCLLPAMERGRVLTDEFGRTDRPDIYAAGDVTGGIMLAHAASAAGRNAVAHMYSVLSGVEYEEAAHMAAFPASSRQAETGIGVYGRLQRRSFPAGSRHAETTGIEATSETPVAAIPSCIYTDPEIASVGMTLAEAEAAGINAASHKALTGANGKSVLSGEERGFVKVVYEKATGRILGAQMMCARASDIISEFTEALTQKLTVRELRRVVRPHPTFEEIITEACKKE